MANLLHIETATQVCSVALSADGQVVELRESNEKNIHSSVLTVFIDEVMKQSGLAFRDLDAVVVSMGPGSYTGLRIGVSTAKGICYALDKPLIAISTLEAMAAGMLKGMECLSEGAPSQTLMLCPMIDARRMEVYNAIFDQDLNTVRETKAEIIDENSFSDILPDHILVLAGDGAEKCRNLLGNHPNVRFIDDFFPSAINMVLPAEKKFQAKAFEDVAYFEPFYLKDFIPGLPKVKCLL